MKKKLLMLAGLLVVGTMTMAKGPTLPIEPIEKPIYEKPEGITTPVEKPEGVEDMPVVISPTPELPEVVKPPVEVGPIDDKPVHEKPTGITNPVENPSDTPEDMPEVISPTPELPNVISPTPELPGIVEPPVGETDPVENPTPTPVNEAPSKPQRPQNTPADEANDRLDGVNDRLDNQDSAIAGLKGDIAKTNDRVDSVGAMSSAMIHSVSSIPVTEKGEIGIGAGLGGMNGASAVAVSVAGMVTDNLKVSGSVSLDEENDESMVGAGVGYKFNFND